jgi:Reverse transcriptase (RNA-dependent DNA polymerase)
LNQKVLRKSIFEKVLRKSSKGGLDKCYGGRDKMIKKNKIWELVEKPKKKYVVGLKWIYKAKTNPDGSVQKSKAKLVAKDYSQ